VNAKWLLPNDAKDQAICDNGVGSNEYPHVFEPWRGPRRPHNLSIHLSYLLSRRYPGPDSSRLWSRAPMSL
jgi:hypothetical protein